MFYTYKETYFFNYKKIILQVQTKIFQVQTKIFQVQTKIFQVQIKVQKTILQQELRVWITHVAPVGRH